MPKVIIYYFVTRRYPWAKMRTYSFCCTTVTKAQAAQILLLHVKIAGPDCAFTIRNSKNTKLKQISLWLLNRAHKIAAAERSS